MMGAIRDEPRHICVTWRQHTTVIPHVRRAAADQRRLLTVFITRMSSAAWRWHGG